MSTIAKSRMFAWKRTLPAMVLIALIGCRSSGGHSSPTSPTTISGISQVHVLPGKVYVRKDTTSPLIFILDGTPVQGLSQATLRVGHSFSLSDGRHHSATYTLEQIENGTTARFEESEIFLPPDTPASKTSHERIWVKSY